MVDKEGGGIHIGITVNEEDHLHKKGIGKKRKTAEPTDDDEQLQESGDAEKSFEGGSRGKRTSHTKIPKFSSLFRNNPEIPQVECLPVHSLNEKVFSSTSFAESNLHPHLVSNLRQRFGFTHMTSVQQETIPHVLEGRDVLVKSQTGSGKTLSYALPIMHILQGREPKVSRDDGPYAIVIVPTRELAQQSLETFNKLIYSFTWIVASSITGGEKRKSEKSRLRKGVNVLIATPGRLLDHLRNTKNLKLTRLKWLIIDEADRLLDMGFEKSVKEVLDIIDEHIGGNRQVILLSATLSSGVQRLAGMSLNDPVRIAISTDDIKKPDEESDLFAIPETLKHHFAIVPNKLRLVTLAAFLLWKCKFSSKKSKVIVFLSTQDAVEFHHSLFTNALNSEEEDEEELQFYKLHGEMKQQERTKVFQAYSQSKAGILLCTDVAARGLDLPYVRWIVQYNTPGTPTDYIHRVGRTARIGTQGRALLFLAPSETEYVRTLNALNISLEEVDMDGILQTLQLRAAELPELPKQNAPQTVQECATSLQIKMESYVSSSKDMKTIARKAFQSFVRAYTSYSGDMRRIFNVKDLHLGHVAKSFCINEAPSQIGGIVGKFAKMDRRGQPHKRNRLSVQDGGVYKPKKVNMKEKMQTLITSEFSSGLAGCKPFSRDQLKKKVVVKGKR